MIVRITRDVVVDGVVRLGVGATRVVTDDDLGMGFGPQDRLQQAYHVPIDVTRPDAGYVALLADDYVVLPDPIGGIDDVIPF